MVLSGLRVPRKRVSTGNGETVVVASKAKMLKAPKAKKGGKKLKARTSRILKKREPQLVEEPKNTVLLRGNKTSQVITDVLRDLKMLKKPDALLLSKKNDIHPFDDENSVDFITTKNDCSLFVMGSHTKKRPNNLIMGRTFNGHVLDMVEFGIYRYKGVSEFKGTPSKQVGSKPCILFQGDEWERDQTFAKSKNLIIDFFRGAAVEKVNLAGLDHVMVCSLVNNKVLIRHYAMGLKKQGDATTPNVELSQMGPSLDLEVRRTRFAAPELWKEATRKPQGLAPKKKKNISREEVSGEKLGRIHLGKQDIDSMQVKRSKALRVKKSSEEKTEKKDE